MDDERCHSDTLASNFRVATFRPTYGGEMTAVGKSDCAGFAITWQELRQTGAGFRAMADHFGCTEVRSELCSLTWRIDKFSMHAARKRVIASPLFGSKLHRAQWRLELHFRDHEESVDMILVRAKSDGDEQFLDFVLSVIGRFQIPHRSKSGEMVLDKQTNAVKLGTINLKYLMGGFTGMDRFWLLPKDSLTLRCEMMVSVDGVVVTYRSKEEYDSHRNTDRSPRYWHAEAWKYVFPTLILLILFVAFYGFCSIFALLVACLILSLFCFNLGFLVSTVAVLWDILCLYLERLNSSQGVKQKTS